MTAQPDAIQRYQVVSRLPGGGMAWVYLAWDPALKRQVAIKVLRHDDDELRERFAREAQSAASLDHPNIVTIYDVGESDGRPFIAMEYIRGETLAEIVRSRTAMPVPRKLALLEELCAGLHFAHEAGIIHRDVKPSNAIVDSKGTLKVLDFGIARILEATGVTQAGMMVGTVNYISPEHMLGQPADHRSDIFAVGVVAYELFAYKQAFYAGLASAVLNKILLTEPEPLATLCPDLDPEVIRIIYRAMEKQPDARYQSLDLMQTDFRLVRQRLESNKADETPRTSNFATRVDREELSRRRAAQIRRRVDAARQAFETGEYETAVAHSEEALLLDPEQPEAMAIIDRAKAALDQRQAEECLAEAETRFRLGALSAALALVDQALALHPDYDKAISTRRKIDDALKERDRQRQRAEAISDGLERAHVNFDRGLFPEAITACDEVLAIAPESGEAQSVKARASEALLAREKEMLERRAREAIQKANRIFGTGDHEQAVLLLSQFEPKHEAVSNALRVLRVDMERLANERRAENERRARLVRITTELNSVRELMARAEFASALDRLRSLEEKEEPSTEIDRAIAEAEAGLLRQEAEQKARAIDRVLESADELLDRRDFDSAWEKSEEALRMERGHVRATELQGRIRKERQADIDRREAERREAARLEEARLAEANRVAEANRAAERRAAEESARREAERRLAEEAARRDAQRKEAERKEAERKEAERKEATRLEAERLVAEERREAARREAARAEAARAELARVEAARAADAKRAAERAALEEAARRQAIGPDEPTRITSEHQAQKLPTQMNPSDDSVLASLQLIVDEVAGPVDDRTLDGLKKPAVQTLVTPPPSSPSPSSSSGLKRDEPRSPPPRQQPPPSIAARPTAAGSRQLDPRVIAGGAAALLLVGIIAAVLMRRAPEPAPSPVADAPVSAPVASPRPTTNLTVAEEQLGSGQILEALGTTTAVLQVEPDNVAGRELLSRILSAARGRLDQARQTANQARQASRTGNRGAQANASLTEAERRFRAREADALERQGNVAGATRTLVDLTGLYLRAANEINSANQQANVDQPPSAPVPPTGGATTTAAAGRGASTAPTTVPPTTGDGRTVVPNRPTTPPVGIGAVPPGGAEPTVARNETTTVPAQPTTSIPSPPVPSTGGQPTVVTPPAPVTSSVPAAPPPVTTRPQPAPTAPQPSARDIAEGAIRSVVNQYVAAYNGLDVDFVRRVYPGIDEGSLRRSFGSLRSQEATLRIDRIDVDQGQTSAVVNGNWSVRSVPKVGNARPQVDARRILLTLRQSGNTWVITGREDAR